MENIVLETAQKYLARGFSIIPIRPDNKKPYILNGKNFKSAKLVMKK